MITDNLDSIVSEERLQARINESPELVALQFAVNTADAALEAIRAARAQLAEAERVAEFRANGARVALQRALFR